MDYFTDDVIRATNKSKLSTAIPLSIFQLEKRSTAQNVWNWTGYQKFVSFSHRDKQILASTQSPIALSLDLSIYITQINTRLTEQGSMGLGQFGGGGGGGGTVRTASSRSQNSYKKTCPFTSMDEAVPIITDDKPLSEPMTVWSIS